MIDENALKSATEMCKGWYITTTICVEENEGLKDMKCVSTWPWKSLRIPAHIVLKV